MLLLGCSLLGSFASILVFIGLKKDQREFLVPYVFVMSLDILVAVLHFFYVVIFGNLKFEPLTGTLFTIDFFILCLNVSKTRKACLTFMGVNKTSRLQSFTDVLSSVYHVAVSRVQKWSWTDHKSLYHG